MASRPLESTVDGAGFDKKSLADMLLNIMDVVNELQTDHATTKVTVDELVTLTTELRADHATNKTAMDNRNTSMAGFKAIYDAHVHTADGNASRTSVPDSGAATGSPSAASAFTITTATNAATITAGAATAGPATLTNATAITNLRS